MINSNIIRVFEETQAATSTGLFGGSNIWSTVITFGLLIAVVLVFYFVVLRPQKKQQKKEEEMKQSLKVGDAVTTVGGIVGICVRVKEETFTIITSKDKTRITFARSALRSIDRPVDAPAPKDETAQTEETKAETKETK